MKTLNDVYNGKAIAEYWGLQSEYPLPWVSYEDIPAISTEYLDELIFSQYGQRPPSPFVLRHLPESGKIDDATALYISRYVFALLWKQIDRYCAAYAAQYNPAENYSLTESGTDTHTNSGTDTDTDSYTNYKETQTFGHTVRTESRDNVYGVDTNANDGVPADYGETSTHYEQGTGEPGDEKTITGTHSTSTQYGKTETIVHQFTRAGNIGVQTAPEMLEKDFALWGANNLWFKIAADVAEILTVPIYE